MKKLRRLISFTLVISLFLGMTAISFAKNTYEEKINLGSEIVETTLDKHGNEINEYIYQLGDTEIKTIEEKHRLTVTVYENGEVSSETIRNLKTGEIITFQKGEEVQKNHINQYAQIKNKSNNINKDFISIDSITNGFVELEERFLEGQGKYLTIYEKEIIDEEYEYIDFSFNEGDSVSIIVAVLFNAARIKAGYLSGGITEVALAIAQTAGITLAGNQVVKFVTGSIKVEARWYIFRGVGEPNPGRIVYEDPEGAEFFEHVEGRDENGNLVGIDVEVDSRGWLPEYIKLLRE